MRDETIPSWVIEAMTHARGPEDWQRLGDRYQSSLETRSNAVDMVQRPPRFIERKIRGVYYTPEALAERVVDATLGPILARAEKAVADEYERALLTPVIDEVRQLKILDPACGTGSLLVSACLRLWRFYQWLNQQLRQSVVDPGAAFNQIAGVDIDPIAAEICRQRIAEMGSDLDCRAADETVVCADALRSDQLAPANVILTNPPFEVLTNFSSNQQAADTAQWVRRSGRFPLSGRGQINLYRLFLEMCLGHLPGGGSLGIILPLSFIGDLQGAKLRKHLFDQTDLQSVTLVAEHSRAFAGAAQGVALLVARRGGRTERVVVERYLGQGDGIGQSSRSVVASSVIRALSPDLWVIPRCNPELMSVLERMSRQPTLSGGEDSVASVRVGELDQTIHRRYICDDPTKILLVRGEHMGERYCVSLEQSGAARYVDPAFVEDGIASGTKRSHMEQERLIFQGIANLGLKRRLRFALCPAGVVLGNSVNYLALHTHDREQVYYYLGILNSRLMNWRFSTTSYGNNISNYEIGQLPVITYEQAGPKAREIAMIAQRLTELAQRRQLKSTEALELDHRMDRLIYGIYEIAEAEQQIIDGEG